ncbi:hypothetical protein MA16_Dca017616 [Dendrobium catenatum]|uniref:Uncharacterized protein n=1 Tax=Dendrobium catenatum TaxID=906689 RepID=A0A2I0XIX6_9ASPA|nr:hypothetical protein MA16_Dca017616 [Dendrobium catenatum]
MGAWSRELELCVREEANGRGEIAWSRTEEEGFGRRAIPKASTGLVFNDAREVRSRRRRRIPGNRCERRRRSNASAGFQAAYRADFEDPLDKVCSIIHFLFSFGFDPEVNKGQHTMGVMNGPMCLQLLQSLVQGSGHLF